MGYSAKLRLSSQNKKLPGNLLKIAGKSHIIFATNNLNGREYPNCKRIAASLILVLVICSTVQSIFLH